MNSDLDRAISQMLQGWVPPAPSDDAVARILAVAQPHAAVAAAPHIWQRKFVIGPALAAAFAVGMVFYPHNAPLPKNDPVLQQSALSTFSISGPSADAEELR